MQRQVLLLIALAACGGEKRRAAPGPAHEVEATASASLLTIRLTARGDYHVNDQYPFKFVPEPTTSVVYEAGTFVLDGKTAGTMTVPFHAGSGTVRVAGKLRLSVCNADECRIEEAPVSASIPAE